MHSISGPCRGDVRFTPESGHVRCTRDVRFVPKADIDGLCIKSLRKEWLVPASHFAILCKLISGGAQCQRFPVAVFAGQCATSAVPNHWNGNLPLHPLSKSVWLGILGECRRSSAEFDVAGTKSRVLCGQRRERETAFAKVLQKLWAITCNRNGGAAGSNNYQGRHSRR